MANPTVLDLITDALDEIGAHAAGDTLTTADSTKALAVLNRMIDTRNSDRAAIAALKIDTWTLTIGKQKYSIGVDPAGILTADFAAVAPVRIERANLLLTAGGSTIRRPLDLLDDDDWAAKRFQNVTSMPIELYNDTEYPLSNYRFYPIPDQAYQFETYTWQQFPQFTTTSTVIAIPPAYYEFWMYGLAIRLAAPFGTEASAATIALYQDARATVAAMNAESPRIKSDSDFGSGGGDYNYLTGTSDES